MEFVRPIIFQPAPTRIAILLLLTRRLGFLRGGSWSCTCGASKVEGPVAHLKLSLGYRHERAPNQRGSDPIQNCDETET
jgi:hypothetical protein